MPGHRPCQARRRKTLLKCGTTALLLSAAGCSCDGSFESAGRSVDASLERSGQAIEEAAQEIEQGFERAFDDDPDLD